MTFPSSRLSTLVAFQFCWRKTLVCNVVGVYAPPHVVTAGKDATRTFYSLHRSEVLQRPQYACLKVGMINAEDQPKTSSGRTPGSLGQVPYGEPTWLTAGYHSPYYTDVSSGGRARDLFY